MPAFHNDPEREYDGRSANHGSVYGDKALFDRFLAAFVQTQDKQTRSYLVQAMSSFRDPAAIRAGVEALIDKKVPFWAGQAILFGGRRFPSTRKLPFELLKEHYDQNHGGDAV